VFELDDKELKDELEVFSFAPEDELITEEEDNSPLSVPDDESLSHATSSIDAMKIKHHEKNPMTPHSFPHF